MTENQKKHNFQKHEMTEIRATSKAVSVNVSDKNFLPVNVGGGTLNVLHPLKSLLSLVAPNTEEVLRLTYIAVETRACHFSGFESEIDWFKSEFGHANWNKRLFKDVLKAVKVCKILQIEPKLSEFNSLIALSKVAPWSLLEFFKLTRMKSGQTMPDPEIILQALNENPGAKKRRVNDEVEQVYSNLIQERSDKFIRGIRTKLKEELEYVGSDRYGILSLSLKQKQFLLLKIENTLKQS